MSRQLNGDAVRQEIFAPSTFYLVAAIALSISTALSFAYASSLAYSHAGLFIPSVSRSGAGAWIQPAFWLAALLLFTFRQSRVAGVVASIATLLLLVDFARGLSWDSTLGTGAATLALNILASYVCLRSRPHEFTNSQRLKYLAIAIVLCIVFAVSGVGTARTQSVGEWWHDWAPDFNSVWLWYKALMAIVALILIRRYPRWLLAVGLVYLVQSAGECSYSLVMYTHVSWHAFGHLSSVWQTVISEAAAVANYLALPVALVAAGVLATLVRKPAR